MKFLCPICHKIPLIKFCFIQEGKVTTALTCKCGKKFQDIYTIISEYTDLLSPSPNEKKFIGESLKDINDENIMSVSNKWTNNERNNSLIDDISSNIIKGENKYIGFCQTCFENIYNDQISEKHKNHLILKIDEKNKKNFIITDDEFESISNKFEKAEEKVINYLPKMRDMLLNSDEIKLTEKNEIKNLAEINIERNKAIISFLKLLYNMYSSNKNRSVLSYQIISNLKNNCDFNLNKYNLDLKNIEKERFISFLQSCIILCCNNYINQIYDNFFSRKEELKKMIFELKPLKEYDKDDTSVELFDIIKSNNSIYFGEKSKINNLAYGRGILFCSSGSHYFGYFKNDYFQCGFGKSIKINDSVYIGNFKNGLADGYGKYITKNGNIYKGIWKENQLNGFGHIIWSNGQIYTGELIGGAFDGIGELKFKNGNLYRGELKKGKLDGIGKIVYKNKKEYIGEFQKGNKNGYGIMTWPVGERYEGSWENDGFKFGEYFWNNGNMFLGSFKKDSVNGFGTFYNSSLGTIETGNWKNGRRVDIKQKDTLPSTRYLSFL